MLNTVALKAVQITDERRAAAAKATVALLRDLDVKRIEEIRRGFELPPECFGFVAEIYAEFLVRPDGRKDEILPMSSGNPVLKTQPFMRKVEIKEPCLL